MTNMHIDYLDHMGNDLMIANVARVSMDKYHDTFDEVSDTRLIKYLCREQHWSPLSHPKIQLRLTLPIFIARQWEKHRIGAIRGYDIFDQNEVSRRYVDSKPAFFYPDSWRLRPESNIKQGSGGTVPNQIELQILYSDYIDNCRATYRMLIDEGLAPEQARMFLPQSMMTSWVETGSLLYWSRVYNLRVDAHAQKEIQDLAVQLDPIMRNLFPVAWPELTQ